MMITYTHSNRMTVKVSIGKTTEDVMEYISTREAAEKWGISERRVQILCKENRIPGVSKIGYMWLIPKSAVKPFDKRIKRSVDNE